MDTELRAGDLATTVASFPTPWHQQLHNREEPQPGLPFECLLGWLYLTGQMARVEELFDALWQQFDPNQK